jgi:predicted Zn-dependent protease
VQPESAWAHYEIGTCLLRTGDFKSAIVHLEIATGRLPAFAPAHLSLAEAYEQTGRTEEAKRERARQTTSRCVCDEGHEGASL